MEAPPKKSPRTKKVKANGGVTVSDDSDPDDDDDDDYDGRGCYVFRKR